MAGSGGRPSMHSWRRKGPRLKPANYVTIGSHYTFKEMLRTHGKSPTSSFLLCPLFSDVLGLPQGAYLDFP